MDTVLIADGSGTFRRRLKDILKKKVNVLTAGDAKTLAFMIASEQPQTLILDLQLPGLDPVEFLETLDRSHLQVLGLSMFLSPYLSQALGHLGVSYLMVRPCEPQSVAQRSLALMEPAGEDRRLWLGLERFSIPMSLRGGQYLMKAVPIYQKRQGQYLVKELYPHIAGLYGIHWQQVERNIRHAIARGWETGNRELWDRHFPGGKPTNGEFIAFMAEFSHNSRLCG